MKSLCICVGDVGVGVRATYLGVNGKGTYVCVITDNRTALVGLTWNGSKRQDARDDSVIACEDSTEELHIKLQLLNILNIDLVASSQLRGLWVCCEEHCAACNEIVSSTHGSIC